MSKLILLHNLHCSKSRAALELLEARSLQPQVVHYLETPPSAIEPKAILAKLGIPIRRLLRTGGDEYKTFDLDEPSLGEEAVIEAMARRPKLIKHPVLVADDKAVIGRPPGRVLGILA